MDTESDATPSRVGRYDIVLPLAAGGTATVYLARPCDGRGAPTSDEHYFALKLVARHGRDPATKRILASARTRRHLRHPNVIPIVDVGDTESGAFILLEYVPGDTLAALRRLAQQRGSALHRGVSLKILVDALMGLHAAHELASEEGAPLGLVHRGLSTRKILVGTDGIARLADFASTASEAILVAGAPELQRGESVDRRADVWSCGAIAWEILTGRTFDPSVAHPRPKEIVPDLDGELDAVVTRALAHDPDARQPSALVLARELEAAARAAATFADTNDVAEQVVRLVGPELVERKELLLEARRQLHKRATAAPDVRTMIGIAGPLPLKRAPLPSLPDLPPPPTDLQSELRIEVNLARPVERAALDVLGPPSAPLLEEPEVFRSPVVIENEPPAPPPDGGSVGLADTNDLAPSPPVQASALAAGVPPEEAIVVPGLRPASPARAAIAGWLSPPWTTNKISTFAGIGGGLVGFILVLVVVSGHRKGDAKAAAASASTPVAIGSAPQSSAPALFASPPPVDSAPPEKAAASEHAVLEIKANAPIKAVTVDGRFVDTVVPTSTVSIDLEDGERDRSLRIVATGRDGRTASGTIEPGTHALTVTFPAKPHTKKPSPASTTKHPWSKKAR